MNSPYRENSMMAMLDAKPEQKGEKGGNGEYWNDVSDDHLSPIRKHLISTYLQVPDEEAMPLLGEYFGVALSFVALGALVRASNSTKKKQKKATEEERLDLRSCSRFQRMALESMLKESMERLRNLSQNAYQMEERVRSLVDENVAQDLERIQLLQRLVNSEKSVLELRGLRKAEGRANERVMSIVAAKEQDWLKEKRSLQKEVDKLKETVSGMTREAKFQARRCRNPTCDHCIGMDRVVRSTAKGRISLRELHSLRDSEAPPKREVLKVGRQLVVPKVDRHQADEEEKVLIKSMENKKKQSEQPGPPDNQNMVERCMELSDSLNTPRAQSSGSTSGSGQSMIVKQQQDMESELANILKRVGMLKQRSYSSTGPPMRKEGSPLEEMQLSDNDKEVPEVQRDEVILDLQLREEQTGEELIIPESSTHNHTLERTNYAASQDSFSIGCEEECDFVELGNAFELRDDQETSPQEEVCLLPVNETGKVKIQPELKKPVEDITCGDGGIAVATDDPELEKPSEDIPCGVGGFPVATDEQQHLLDEDAAFAVFESSLDSREGLGLAECQSEGKMLESNKHERETELPESEGLNRMDSEGLEFFEAQVEFPVKDDVFGIEPASSEGTGLLQNAETVSSSQDYQERNVLSTDGDGLQSNVSSDACGLNKNVDAYASVVETLTDSPAGDQGPPIHRVANCTEEHEQVLKVVEHENKTDECSNANNPPINPVTGAVLNRLDPSAVDVSKQPDQDQTEYDSGSDFQEGWDVKDVASSTGGGLLENQDIPLFERKNVDDLTGELPEPEEKRVCGSEILDSGPTVSTDELSSTTEQKSSHQGGENKKDKDRTTVEEVGSGHKEDLAGGGVGLVTDEKPKMDKVTEHSCAPEHQDVIPVSEN